MNPKIAQINRPALKDDEKIVELIKYIRDLDEGAAEIIKDAENMKIQYDNICKKANEARLELLKYGIQVDNQFGGTVI